MKIRHTAGLKARLLSCIALSALLAQHEQAQAQDASSSNPAGQARPTFSDSDIIVTARKREETSLTVPVAIAAVGAQELSRRAINSLDGIARIVPSLVIAENGGSGQGGTVALRGITGPDNNNFGDQAVSFNIDGFQIAKSSVRRLAEMDIAQVEVLKGPQALFFGKNSPAGVVSMRTADPTNKLEAGLSSGYEFRAHEWRSEGYISSPITDGLGVRLAGYYSDMRGWVRNTFQSGTPLSPPSPWGPQRTEYALRGTLKYDNGGPFTARFKANYSNAHGSGPAYNFQYISCPVGGVPQLPGVLTNDCKADDRVYHSDFGPGFAAINPLYGNGQTYGRNDQTLISLEMNYALTPHLKLTSVSGYYDVHNKSQENFGYSVDYALLPSRGFYTDREWSTELRLGSSFDGPINFTVGGIYSNTRATNDQDTYFGVPGTINAFGLPSPTLFNKYYFLQNGKAYSGFGELMWKVIPTVELSAGGRYSHEEKSIPISEANLTGALFGPEVQQTPSTSHVAFNDFSPEITVSWRPTTKLNLYASYKRGFLSGGFNASSDALQPGARVDYGPQKVRGFEGGLKAVLLDGRMRANLAVFDYDVLGLQVNSYQAGISSIRNAGKVSIKGSEFDVNYRTPISGLDVHGSIAYLHARYVQYIAPCYTGQTQALGCNLDIVGGLGTTQNLAGTPAPNAPDWTAGAGLTYNTALGNGLKGGFSTDVNYSASYVTDSKNSPFSRPPAQALVDASLRVGAENDRWELALIGRNLTNRYYWNNSQGLFPSGAGTGGGPGTVGIPEDRFAVISRSREIMIRGTVKY